MAVFTCSVMALSSWSGVAMAVRAVGQQNKKFGCIALLHCREGMIQQCIKIQILYKKFICVIYMRVEFYC